MTIPAAKQADPKSIGVALSGGGHRATAYALGVLLYLVDSGLNKRVRTITSVSGGSILNAFVALLSSSDGTSRRSFASFDGFGSFDPDAARLAALLAGNRTVWFACVAIALLVETAILAAFFLAIVEASTALMLLAALLLVLSTVIGPRSGGSLWGWWGTWLYCGSIMWLAAATVIAAGRTPRASLAAFIIGGLLCGWLAQQRHRVAERAFEHTICRPPTRTRSWSTKRARLEDMDTDVRHVFCATEMHSGKHAYFSHDMVYARGFGLGKPNGLPVATAVQVSANFPGGFPLRPLRVDRFKFSVTDRFEDAVEDGITIGRDILMSDEDIAWASTNRDFPKLRSHPDWLLLSDGGVFDNLGADWFLDSEARRSRFLMDLNWDWNYETHSWFEEGTNSRDTAILDVLRHNSDYLIIVNAGITVHWRVGSIMNMALPLIGEVMGLSRISETMYNNNTKERIRALREHMVIEIGYAQRRLPTTLLPLGTRATAYLLWTGYERARGEAYKRFGQPYFDVNIENFTRLAQGHHGGRTRKVPDWCNPDAKRPSERDHTG